VALINTNQRDVGLYLLGSAFQPGSHTRLTVHNGETNYIQTVYIDRDDLVITHLSSVENGNLSARLDPNLVNNTASNVGIHVSPISGGDQPNFPYFVSDFYPAANTQRLFQSAGGGIFTEIDINDPTVEVEVDPWPNIQRTISDGISNPNEGHWVVLNGSAGWVFFPGIDSAIVCSARVYIADSDLRNNIIALVTLSTGFAIPLGVPSRYAAGENEFNRPPAFGETAIEFTGLQFIPDSDSTHAQPKGELLFWSRGIIDTGDFSHCYIKLVDFNPSAVAGLPNRVHLRETLFSRINLELDVVPSGGPPLSPLNGLPNPTNGSIIHPNIFFTSFGQKRLNIVGTDGTLITDGHTNMAQFATAAAAAFISTPSQKGEPTTNQRVTVQTEVTGDLGENIANATVDWLNERLSTKGEVLATTPTPGETVTVANDPIDRGIEFPFAVKEDGVPLTETTNYTVDEALGEITFVGPKPLAGGEVYTCDYAHTAAPATPPHGAVLDTQTVTDINGVTQARISYPDDDTLDEQIDQITATTAT
jgi:hypothetical protein